MLLEFSGPSGVGKTTFCRHLLKRNPAWASLRGSPEDRRPFHQHVRLSFLGRKELRRFRGIKEQLIQLSLDGDEYIRRRLPSPVKLTVENTVLSGAKISKRVWLLDQGRFQLQGWLPRSVLSDQQRLAARISKLIVFADILIIFRCSPPLVVSRIEARGDLSKRNALSEERGFSSLLDMSEYDYSLATTKLRTALAMGADSLLIDIESDDSLPKMSIHHASGDRRIGSSAHRVIFNQLRSDFKVWWS
jgi:hypothetical protein